MVNQSVKLVLVGFLSFFLFSGCAEDSPLSATEQKDEAENSATAIVRILDFESNEPIKDVKVKVYGTESTITDVDGIANLGSLKSGSYIISAEKADYETIESRLSLKTLKISENTSITDNVIKSIYLSKKNASFKGYVYCQVSPTKKQPAANATLKVIVRNNSNYQDSSTFRNPIRTVTTDEKGFFRIDSLPKGAVYSVAPTLYFLSNIEYGSSESYSTYGNLGLKDTTQCEPIILRRYTRENFIVLSNNADSITVRDTLKVVFTENIDVASITSDSISVLTIAQNSYSSSYQTVLVGYTVKENSLLVYPYNGVWTKNKNYTLKIIGIKSSNGGRMSSIDIPFIIRDKGAVPKIDVIKVSTQYSDTARFDYNTTNVSVYWKKLSTVSEYTAFIKTSEDSNWVSNVTSSDENANVNLPAGSLENGGQVSLIVLGKNGQSYSNIASAKIFTIKDNVGPRFSSNGYSMTISNTNNTSGAKETVIKTIYQSFPEPMDTTVIPTVVVSEGGAGYEGGDAEFKIANPVWKWVTPTKAEITVKVPIGKNGTNDTISFNFSKCKDLSGNLALSEYTGNEPLITYVTR